MSAMGGKAGGTSRILLIACAATFSFGQSCRVKSPGPGMTFSEGIPIRFLADAFDPDAWIQNKHEAQSVTFLVDGMRVDSAGTLSGEFDHFETIVTGLKSGSHKFSVRSLNLKGTVTQGDTITIVVEPIPTHAKTVNLERDTVLAGSVDLDWEDATVFGHGFRVKSAAGWKGKAALRNAFITGLGSMDSTGIDLSTSGDVTLENSVFEGTGALRFDVNGTGRVQVRGCDFRANNLIAYVAFDPGRSPIFHATGNSTGEKIFQGNRIGGGYLHIERMQGWAIGGTGAGEGNILVGPRCEIALNDSRDCRIQGNYDLHDYKGGWSQGFNLITSGSSSGILIEHNFIKDGSWPVQDLGGEFRYNMVVNSGHNWLRTVQDGTRIHHNLFVHTEANDINSGLWIYKQVKDVAIWNNTFDGGGENLDFLHPAIELTAGEVASLRNNLFTGFRTPAPEAVISRDVADTATGSRILYADYNAFANPAITGPVHYSPGLVAGKAGGEAGFGAHDAGGFGAEIDPKLAGKPQRPYPDDQDSVWNRLKTVAQILAGYRTRYAPASGSPLIDAGDPADGAGADIGAVGAGKEDPADAFGKPGAAGAIGKGPRYRAAPVRMAWAREAGRMGLRISGPEGPARLDWFDMGGRKLGSISCMLRGVDTFVPLPGGAAAAGDGGIGLRVFRLAYAGATEPGILLYVSAPNP